MAFNSMGVSLMRLSFDLMKKLSGDEIEKVNDYQVANHQVQSWLGNLQKSLAKTTFDSNGEHQEGTSQTMAAYDEAPAYHYSETANDDGSTTVQTNLHQQFYAFSDVGFAVQDQLREIEDNWTDYAGSDGEATEAELEALANDPMLKDNVELLLKSFSLIDLAADASINRTEVQVFRAFLEAQYPFIKFLKKDTNGQIVLDESRSASEIMPALRPMLQDLCQQFERLTSLDYYTGPDSNLDVNQSGGIDLDDLSQAQGTINREELLLAVPELESKLAAFFENPTATAWLIPKAGLNFESLLVSQGINHKQAFRAFWEKAHRNHTLPLFGVKLAMVSYSSFIKEIMSAILPAEGEATEAQADLLAALGTNGWDGDVVTTALGACDNMTSFLANELDSAKIANINAQWQDNTLLVSSILNALADNSLATWQTEQEAGTGYAQILADIHAALAGEGKSLETLKEDINTWWTAQRADQPMIPFNLSQSINQATTLTTLEATFTTWWDKVSAWADQVTSNFESINAQLPVEEIERAALEADLTADNGIRDLIYGYYAYWQELDLDVWQSEIADNLKAFINNPNVDNIEKLISGMESLASLPEMLGAAFALPQDTATQYTNLGLADETEAFFAQIATSLGLVTSDVDPFGLANFDSSIGSLSANWSMQEAGYMHRYDQIIAALKENQLFNLLHLQSVDFRNNQPGGIIKTLLGGTDFPGSAITKEFILNSFPELTEADLELFFIIKSDNNLVPKGGLQDRCLSQAELLEAVPGLAGKLDVFFKNPGSDWLIWQDLSLDQFNELVTLHLNQLSAEEQNTFRDLFESTPSMAEQIDAKLSSESQREALHSILEFYEAYLHNLLNCFSLGRSGQVLNVQESQRERNEKEWKRRENQQKQEISKRQAERKKAKKKQKKD
jgi:hypothetical protein